MTVYLLLQECQLNLEEKCAFIQNFKSCLNFNKLFLKHTGSPCVEEQLRKRESNSKYLFGKYSFTFVHKKSRAQMGNN